MKKLCCFILSVLLMFSLSACGISQAEYDALLSENDSLSTQIKSLSTENTNLSTQIESLSAENNSLSTKVESLSAENASLSAQVESLLDSQFNQITDNSYIKAWAATIFGDGSLCLTDEKELYLQCISSKSYVVSDEGISDLLLDVSDSIKLLSATQVMDPDKISYETISIKFVDPSGDYILDIVLNRKNQTYSIGAIMCNITYLDTLIPVLLSIHEYVNN